MPTTTRVVLPSIVLYNYSSLRFRFPIFVFLSFQLMEPVRNLRQNCSILHILDKDGKTIVMRPEQMLEYLINTNESDAKRELKLIELRLKSYTALGLGNHKMSGTVIMEALNACQNVLNWAKNYKEESTMCVYLSIFL